MTGSVSLDAPAAWRAESAQFPRLSPARTTAPRLILVAIDKGGVGKSFFCIQMISWLRHLGIPYTAYDPDHANSSLSRFIHDAIFLNSQHTENLDLLVERLRETPIVILDGMVGRQGLVFDWLEETNLPDICGEMGFAITMVLVIEDDKDAVHQAGEAVKRLGAKVDWLVVRNHKVSHSFRIFAESQARRTLLQNGAHEIDLPKLQPHLTEILQRDSTTIDEALGSGRLHVLDRQRLVDFRRRVFMRLDAVRDVLL